MGLFIFYSLCNRDSNPWPCHCQYHALPAKLQIRSLCANQQKTSPYRLLSFETKQESLPFLTASKTGGVVLKPAECLAENLHPNSQRAENNGTKTIKSLHCDPSTLPGVKKGPGANRDQMNAGPSQQHAAPDNSVPDGVFGSRSVTGRWGTSQFPWHVSRRVENKQSVECQIRNTML